MTFAATIQERYEEALTAYGEVVDVKRGAVTATGRARIVGFRGGALVGNVVQGETRIRVLVADLAADGLTLPILPTDKVIFRGQQRTITNVDNNTGRVGGNQIYAVVVVSGSA
jgi:hypothetical protein